VLPQEHESIAVPADRGGEMMDRRGAPHRFSFVLAPSPPNMDSDPSGGDGDTYYRPDLPESDGGPVDAANPQGSVRWRALSAVS
jgi:hypothetical protein